MKSSPAANWVWPFGVVMAPALLTSVPISSTKPPPAVTEDGALVVISAPLSTTILPPAPVKFGT